MKNGILSFSYHEPGPEERNSGDRAIWIDQVISDW